eukprot:698818-Prorocentrum_minimum.AAC.1
MRLFGVRLRGWKEDRPEHGLLRVVHCAAARSPALRAHLAAPAWLEALLRLAGDPRRVGDPRPNSSGGGGAPVAHRLSAMRVLSAALRAKTSPATPAPPPKESENNLSGDGVVRAGAPGRREAETGDGGGGGGGNDRNGNAAEGDTKEKGATKEASLAETSVSAAGVYKALLGVMAGASPEARLLLPRTLEGGRGGAPSPAEAAALPVRLATVGVLRRGLKRGGAEAAALLRAVSPLLAALETAVEGAGGDRRKSLSAPAGGAGAVAGRLAAGYLPDTKGKAPAGPAPSSPSFVGSRVLRGDGIGEDGMGDGTGDGMAVTSEAEADEAREGLAAVLALGGLTDAGGGGALWPPPVPAERGGESGEADEGGRNRGGGEASAAFAEEVLPRVLEWAATLAAAGIPDVPGFPSKGADAAEPAGGGALRDARRQGENPNPKHPKHRDYAEHTEDSSGRERFPPFNPFLTPPPPQVVLARLTKLVWEWTSSPAWARRIAAHDRGRTLAALLRLAAEPVPSPPDLTVEDLAAKALALAARLAERRAPAYPGVASHGEPLHTRGGRAGAGRDRREPGAESIAECLHIHPN